MTAPLFQLQRMFWSLYGRFVWDKQKALWKAPQVRHIVEILTARRAGSGERVLDAGCGTGNYAVALAQAGFHVIGIDYASGMLARAQAKVTHALASNLSFQQVDLNERLRFPDSSFDHVISISVLQAVVNPAFTLEELWRVLKPGGTIVLLHVPKPESHELPLRDVIKHRVTNLDNRTPLKVVLVAAKSWAERTERVRYWTSVELQEMFRTSKYNVLSVDHGPPIIVVAEKLKNLNVA